MPPEPIQPKKEIHPPLFISILLVIAGLIGSFQIYEYLYPSPASTRPPDGVSGVRGGARGEVSDWKTYRNEEYGFEFKYPEDLKISIDNGTNIFGGIIVSLDPNPKQGEYYDRAEASLYGLKVYTKVPWTSPEINKNLERYFDKLSDKPLSNHTCGLSVNYDGFFLGFKSNTQAGKECNGESAHSILSFQDFYILKDLNIYHFTLRVHGNDQDNLLEREILFNKILSTFKFIK